MEANKSVQFGDGLDIEKGNNKTKKRIIIFFSAMIAIITVVALIFACKYMITENEIADKQEDLEQLTIISADIEQTYNLLLESVDNVKANCGSGIEKLIMDSKSDIDDFEKYACDLKDLICEHQIITFYDYSDVYCDVRAIVNDTLEWREEALENSIQWDDEYYNVPAGVSAVDDVSSRAEEAVQDMVDEFYGVENYSLEKMQKDELFPGIEEIIENKQAKKDINLLIAESNSMRTYMIISVVVDIMLIFLMVILLIKVNKDRKAITY